MNITKVKLDNRYTAKKAGFNYAFALEGRVDHLVMIERLDRYFNSDNKRYFCSHVSAWERSSSLLARHNIIHYVNRKGIKSKHLYLFRNESDCVLTLLALIS